MENPLERFVTHVVRDHGRIVQLAGNGWDPVTIEDVDEDEFEYLVADSPERNPIHAVHSMRTFPKLNGLNLSKLPELPKY